MGALESSSTSNWTMSLSQKEPFRVPLSAWPCVPPTLPPSHNDIQISFIRWRAVDDLVRVAAVVLIGLQQETERAPAVHVYTLPWSAAAILPHMAFQEEGRIQQHDNSCAT